MSGVQILGFRVRDAGGKPAPAGREQLSGTDPVVQALVEAVGSATAPIMPDQEFALSAQVEAHERQCFRWCAERDALADRASESMQVFAVRNVEVCLDLLRGASCYSIGRTAGNSLIRIEPLVGFGPLVC